MRPLSSQPLSWTSVAVLCLVILTSVNARAQKDPKEVIYNHIIGEKSELDRQIEGIYGVRYRIVDVLDSPDFQKAKPTVGNLPNEARDENGELLPGYVLVSYIVSEKGEVIEPHVLKSTEERANSTALNAVKPWRFKPAQLNGKPIATLAAQEFKFRSGTETIYENPIDGKSYSADWKTYAPATPAKQPDDGIKAGPIRLLTEDALFQKNVSTEALVEFIKETEKQVRSAPKAEANFELLIQVTLLPTEKPEIRMSSKGKAPKEVLQAVHDSLQKVPDLRSKADPLPFQMQFTFGRGGSD